jgi:hypothetical protein
MYHIILRTCDVVHSLHNAPRPYGLDKRTLIKVCFLSLLKSLEGFEYKIHIVGDRLSDEMLAFFRQYPVEMTLGEYGNDESIRQCLRIAYLLPEEDWAYICEDDYLHTPNAFLWIDDLIKHKKEYLGDKALARSVRFIRVKLHKRHIVIHTPDYPDRYKRRYMRFGLIFLSRYCHWRQISNTTFTLMAQVRTFKKFQRIFDGSAAGASDGYLSRHLFAGIRFGNKALCLSPIPGVATHMHEDVMTPLVDWEKIVKDTMKEIV